ncbi:hypothetical protein [Streptomyces sp. NBC_01727]|uniref:hypothetical protein n=1 Tax=Streptomyces sp. NBC_01727 TaxID=2975924 RepID=UPI002E12A645|nr:hypothetical protein OIE76_06785 [Streptomyces sp. NBC_01727]
MSCDDVRPCISAGPGAAYDPATGVIAAHLSTDAGNTLAVGGDDGLFVPAAAGVSCDDVRPCISAGPGAAYDPATGVISAHLSTDAGNTLVVGGDDGLFVPAAADATVTTGCGLGGDGSAGDPLAVATGAWPYACSADTSGGVVVCGSDGVLRGEPRGKASFVSYFEERMYPNLTVPNGFDQPGASFSTDVTNPDPCRDALLIVWREVDVDFNLPAGAGAGYGQDTDEMFYTRNAGSSLNTDVHVQTTKTFHNANLLGPGATVNIPLDVTFDRGTGGATYNRIQINIRVLMISL